MKYDIQKHHRRSIRLPDYDYTSQGYYFVTICSQQRKCLFGDIHDDVIVLNDLGRIAHSVWHWLDEHHDHVELDIHIVMPNHLHGIIILSDKRSGDSRIATTTRKRKPLGRLVGVFKTVSTKQINQIRNTPGERVWQRNYGACPDFKSENTLSGVMTN